MIQLVIAAVPPVAGNAPILVEGNAPILVGVFALALILSYFLFPFHCYDEDQYA